MKKTLDAAEEPRGGEELSREKIEDEKKNRQQTEF